MRCKSALREAIEMRSCLDDGRLVLERGQNDESIYFASGCHQFESAECGHCGPASPVHQAVEADFSQAGQKP